MSNNKQIYWKEDDIYAQYLFGSRVYGTNTNESDWDYITILKNWNGRHEQYRVSQDWTKNNIHAYNTHSIETFQKALDKNELYALECVDAPDMFPANKGRITPPFPWKYKFDINTIETDCDNRCFDDIVKSEKKLKDGNFSESKKILFHAVRTNNFKNQIRKFHKIIDFGAANQMWEEIYTTPDSEFNKLYWKYADQIWNDSK